MSYNGLTKSTYEHVTLVSQKLEEWNWIQRFLALNPDVNERWEQHKTYEILKDEHLPYR